MMDFDALKRNITDEIEEGLLKLGYREEAIRLYYPRTSLCALLGEELDLHGMGEALADFSAQTAEELGGVMVSSKKERFCLTVPPEGVARIWARTDKDGFLAQFIELMRGHGVTMEQVKALFLRFSDQVHVERTTHGEFDWLIYFEDGRPSDYYYCLSEEGHHMIYHRFTKADYLAMGL